MAELETPEEREWWRNWIGHQMENIARLQAKHPDKGFQAVSTTSQREAEFRWVFDKVSDTYSNAYMILT